MAKQTPQPAPKNAPAPTWRGAYSLEQRETMIREAAYYHYMKRGHTPGHDLDDWLAAEAELERDAPGDARSEEFAPESGMQQSGAHGASKDDELKRIARQHPQRGIPQVEGIEPEEAPFRE